MNAALAEAVSDDAATLTAEVLLREALLRRYRDLPGCVAFMKLGNSVSVLARVPWLHGVRAVYWGDIDTHGFAILGQARAALLSITSVLMDEATLLANRALWTREAVQYPNAQPLHLTADERAVFDRLYNDFWGQGVRLEQERVPWPLTLDALRCAVAEG